MNNFSKRIISGIIYVVVFITAILWSENSYLILIFLFANICLWEFLKLVKLNNIISYVLLAVLSLLLLFYREILLNERPILLSTVIYTILSSVIMIIGLFRNNTKNKYKLTTFFLPIKYIVFPFFFLMLLPFIDGVYHPNIIIYTIVIIWVNDSFAYLVGKNFGKTKLLERISPKKTIEGFVGGLTFSVVTGILIGTYTSYFTTLNWICIAIIIAIFGMLGDLVESKFKREAHVKDSGKIMPGHGGLLDRLDSLFFIAPFVYLYIHYLL